MTIHFLASHEESAQALYVQRCFLQQQPLVDASMLAGLEQRLFIHLHVLAHRPQTSANPTDEGETFVCLASQLLSRDRQRRLAGYEQAVTCLAEGGAVQQGAFQALALVSIPAEGQQLLELYRETPHLRALLFQLWQEQSYAVPAALTSAAELRGLDPHLQVAALQYASRQAGSGLDLFAPYLQGWQGDSRPAATSGLILAAALWGARLHGDRTTDKHLWRCIETESEPEAFYQLLRLGAMTAEPKLVEVIRHYAAKHPERAAELLALHGTREAIDALLSLTPQLKDPALSAQIWRWVSGTDLQVSPHLQLVTEQTGADRQNGPTVWWNKHRDRLAVGQRLLMGRQLDIPWVRQQCLNWAGRFSHHLLDLLAYLQGAPVGISANVLQVKRQHHLAQEAPQRVRQEAR